jgi:hypothetical protein
VAWSRRPAFILRTYIHLMDDGVGDAAFLDEQVGSAGGTAGSAPRCEVPIGHPKAVVAANEAVGKARMHGVHRRATVWPWNLRGGGGDEVLAYADLRSLRRADHCLSRSGRGSVRIHSGRRVRGDVRNDGLVDGPRRVAWARVICTAIDPGLTLPAVGGRACVNPDHLEALSHAEYLARHGNPQGQPIGQLLGNTTPGDSRKRRAGRIGGNCRLAG